MEHLVGWGIWLVVAALVHRVVWRPHLAWRAAAAWARALRPRTRYLILDGSAAGPAFLEVGSGSELVRHRARIAAAHAGLTVREVSAWVFHRERDAWHRYGRGRRPWSAKPPYDETVRRAYGPRPGREA